MPLTSLYNKMSENNINLRVPKTPDEKESSYNNSFNIVNILSIIGYLGYNFSIEWQNWDKLSKPPINGTWRVSVSDEIESQVLRLEEVCKQIDSLTQMFIVTLIVTIFWSFTRFVCRQWLIFEQSLRSNGNCQWFFSLMLLAILNQLQTGLTLFGILLILPTSFFTCYNVFSRYLCTIAISCFVAWFILSLIISIISKPILNYRIPYQELGSVGKNVELDVKRKKYKDRKYEEEEVSLNDAPETV